MRGYLNEDRAWNDITGTTLIAPDTTCTARIIARKNCVIAGLRFAEQVFLLADDKLEFTTLARDGRSVAGDTVVAEVRGAAQAVLMAERTVLNVLQHTTTIATHTRSFVDLVKDTRAKIYDTRKTTPGMRRLDKYAVKIGGGHNHRFNLGEAVLIKDNHLSVLGKQGMGIKNAVELIRKKTPSITVEVEVETLEQAREAVNAGVDIVLLDNMSVAQVERAVKLAGGVTTEASGGINLSNVRSYALTGVDRLAVGALTQSAPAVDLALEIV